MGIHIKHQTHVSKALLIGKIRYFPFNIMTLMRKSHETDHSFRLWAHSGMSASHCRPNFFFHNENDPPKKSTVGNYFWCLFGRWKSIALIYSQTWRLVCFELFCVHLTTILRIVVKKHFFCFRKQQLIIFEMRLFLKVTCFKNSFK